MNRFTDKLIALGLILIAALAVSACSRSATRSSAEPPRTAKQVFEDKCSRCHALNYSLAENHDQAGWRKRVTECSARWKWLISAEEEEAIIGYLVRIRPPKVEVKKGPTAKEKADAAAGDVGKKEEERQYSPNYWNPERPWDKGLFE